MKRLIYSLLFLNFFYNTFAAEVNLDSLYKVYLNSKVADTIRLRAINIPFISRMGLPAGEASEQELIDHPWVQRLRQIHQLQTAWWVFPSAEHMRFQHVLGVMHLGSVTVNAWYDSLVDSCGNVPSRACVESMVRIAGLLHDVGHGPFSHLF